MNMNEHIGDLTARMREHGGIVPATVYGLLQVRGKDTIDLLHRLSTNDLRKCRPGVPVATVFTTERGRIIDRVEVMPHDGGMWMVCHDHALGRIREWITTYTIMEDVEVLDATPDYTMISMVGDNVDSMALGTGLPPGPAGSPQWWRSSFGPLTMMRVVGRAEESAPVLAGLVSKGAYALTGPEFTMLRVACGVPAHPEELNDAHNPLESGLRNDISFTKGCYIGQEVIARLDAYDKVQRVLVVLAVRADGAMVREAAGIASAEGIVGAVTTRGGLLGEHHEVMVMGRVSRRALDEADPLTVDTVAGPKPARILELSVSSGVSGSMGA